MQSVMDITSCGLGHQVPEFLSIRNVAAIRKAFYTDGIAFIAECDEDSLVQLGEILGSIVKPRHEAGGRGVSNIRFAPHLEGKGYGSEELFFHTDRSGWDTPPRILITTLKVKSSTGGGSLLVDGRQLISTLRIRDPALYKFLLDEKLSSFRSDDGMFVPRPIYDESTGVLRFRFDDGIQLSATLVEKLPKLRSMIYEHAFATELEPGQSYIVDNHRFLHGRTSFEGPRELLRVLAHPHPSEGPKVVLFDVDGTLCRAEALSIDAFYRCVTDVTGMSITHENTKVDLHGRTDLSLLRDILHYHGFSEADMATAVHEFFEIHPKYLEDSLRNGFTSVACAYVRESLNWLSQQKTHARIGLLTGNSRANALLKIQAAGLSTDVFDLEISSFGDVHPSRVSLVQHSISQCEAYYGMPVQASSVVLVGDTPADIQCANVAKCSVIAVASGNYTKDQLAPLKPDFLCERLADSHAFLSKFTQGFE